MHKYVDRKNSKISRLKNKYKHIESGCRSTHIEILNLNLMVAYCVKRGLLLQICVRRGEKEKKLECSLGMLKCCASWQHRASLYLSRRPSGIYS